MFCVIMRVRFVTRVNSGIEVVLRSTLTAFT